MLASILVTCLCVLARNCDNKDVVFCHDDPATLCVGRDLTT